MTQTSTPSAEACDLIDARTEVERLSTLLNTAYDTEELLKAQIADLKDELLDALRFKARVLEAIAK